MLVLNAQSTALVIVDLQHGVLGLPMTPNHVDDVVARAVELAHALARAGGTIVTVTVDYAEGYADRPNRPTDAPLRLPAEGLPENWATLVPEISALSAKVHITKRQQSAFFGTELDLQLRRRGIGTVVICGLATNFGVEATARDAHNLNYAVVIAADTCSSTAPGLHEFAITHILPRISRVRGSAEIVAALGASGSNSSSP